MIELAPVEKLEIDITATCNQGCLNCNRMCNLANGSAKDDIRVETVENFILDSIDCDWPWKELHVVGGEPTLHPNLKEITDILVEYKEKHNKDVRIVLMTNGILTEKLIGLNGNIEIVFPPNQRKHKFITVAPIDLGIYDISKNVCRNPRWCGICLAREGVFPCAPGAAIARIFGIQCAIKSFKDISAVKLIHVANQHLCQFCGYFLAEALENPPIILGDMQPVSSTWKSRLLVYHDEQKK